MIFVNKPEVSENDFVSLLEELATNHRFFSLLIW